MIARLAASDVTRALDRQAAVALLGPRQVGKTTLALELGGLRNALYLDLEDRDDRARLVNPGLFFDAFADRLVILDEIHRMPALLETLRGVIDRARRRDEGHGRFLILGSASIDLMRQTSETLAGRIAFVDLTPLLVEEVGLHEFSARERLWLRGGFPQSYLAPGDDTSMAIRNDFIRTYLERDIPMFGPRLPAATLGRLWSMLAQRQGSLLQASEIARALEISTQSVNRYIDLLTDLLLLRRLPPYSANLGKRLVKSPKIYVRDSGIVHALLGIASTEQLLGHPLVGATWEGFVIENLLNAAPARTTPFFYRTAAGAEIDLVLEIPGGRLVAVEIKRSPAARPERGFHQAVADLKPWRSFVVHGREERYPIFSSVEGIGLPDLLRWLRSGAPDN